MTPFLQSNLNNPEYRQHSRVRKLNFTEGGDKGKRCECPDTVHCLSATSTHGDGEHDNSFTDTGDDKWYYRKKWAFHLMYRRKKKKEHR